MSLAESLNIQSGSKVYGTAGLDIDKSAARYAYCKGLFVVAVTGDDMVSILNDDQFRPRDFS